MLAQRITTATILLMAATSASAFMAAQQQQRRPSYLENSSESNVERIEYKIYPDGRVEQTVKGVKGEECVKLTEDLNNALGEVVSQTPTEEMFEQKLELDQTLTNTQSEGGSGESFPGASSW